MKFLSHWLKGDTVVGRNYESLLWLESEILPGVEFSLRKVSLAQRIELSSRVRELTLRNEFLRSGEPKDQVEARIAELLVQKLYVQWAVVDLRGLRIDGQKATVELLLERGPEALVQEMVDAIHSHLELSDEERKNF
jgi:hypothetical protein